MSEITELMARSLTLDELSSRLVDHSDVAVRVFAQRVMDAAIQEREHADVDDAY
jgi:hypothetical protein